jgi:gliding motility-associated-like protein
VEYSGGVPPYDVLWESGESSDILTNLSASDYLSVTIRDLNNCQIIDSIQLIEPSALASSISSVFDYNGYEISCHDYTDGGINLDIFGGIAPYLTSWNNGETVEDLNNLSEGLYSVSIVDQNNCSNSNQITLNEPTPLNLNFDISNYNGFNISCNGFEDGFINTLVSGSVPPYSYEWNTGVNTQNLFLLSSGNYDVQISDLNNCEIYDEIELTEPNNFFINLSNSKDTCNRGVGQGIVYITPEANPYEILWSNGETDYEINNLFIGDNSVTVTDMYGCEKSIDFFTGNLPSPIANFYIEPQNDSLFYQVNSNLNFFDESTDSWSIINSWNWDFGDGNSDTTMNTNHTYNSIGYYNVLLRINNIHGCMDTVSKILEMSDFIIHFPNAFTPQGDLINERFSARGINIKELHMTIYSRWGEQIFITTDINEGWDGTYQSTGKKCPQGVYVYDVHITDAFGDLHRFTGDVTLID